MAKIAKTAWWTGWANLSVAVLLGVSPWALGFSSDDAALATALVTGILIGAFAVAGLMGLADAFFTEWEEWAGLALGVWTIAAPWIVGFAGLSLAVWTHVALGLVAAGVSAWGLWQVHRIRHIHAPA